MAMGRPPKAPELKLLEGNPGRRPIKPIVKPQPIEPPMPRGMPAPARKIWRSYAAKLSRLGLLTELDSAAFEMFCRELALYRKYAAMVDKGDDIQVNVKTNNIRPSAPFSMMGKCFERVRILAAEFGLTPLARNRIHVAEPDDDEFSQFLDN